MALNSKNDMNPFRRFGIASKVDVMPKTSIDQRVPSTLSTFQGPRWHAYQRDSHIHQPGQLASAGTSGTLMVRPASAAGFTSLL
jgi:hypothetical protein